ncbi:P2 family phage major capsid protein [Pasteurella skyensis]|uniref:P2 family phage major capsid protein n=1 Tax=Phocoenobacter skyensis TaxID=97481 RepID=A0AAJ6ND70_9PAST|nr:P2 family phage major capsid protein [Pasteurella skyensis]MDP8170553.1 P2 family phage major capsid protein [Pasteurella skyensis]MDP8174620.1 P2 family phage major capsid protein [Pasteurella skyensis]
MNNFTIKKLAESKDKSIFTLSKVISEEQQRFLQHKVDFTGWEYLDKEKEQDLLSNLQTHPLFRFINLAICTNMALDIQNSGKVIAGTTDTRTTPRDPKIVLEKESKEVNVQQINIDSNITYNDLDSFISTSQKEKKLEAVATDDIISNLIMLGFNGTHRSKNSDPQLYPLGQDVIKGWLQKIRDDAPQSVLNNETVGKAQSNKNLNDLFKKAKKQLPPVIAKSGKLIAICGSNILPDVEIQFTYNELSFKKEQATLSQKTIAGIKCIVMPYFPENSVLITTLDNLRLAFQNNTTRFALLNNPSKSRIEHWFSTNVDYIIDSYKSAILIENIEIIEDE